MKIRGVGKWLFGGTVLIVVVASTLYLLGPEWIERDLYRWAERERYREAHVDVTRVQPFAGEISIRDLRLVSSDGSLLEAQDAEIDVSMLALLRGEVRLEFARLTGARLHVNVDHDGGVRVAGLRLGGEPGSDGTDGVSMALLHVVDGAVHLKTPQLETRIKVDDIQLVDGNELVADTVQLRDLSATVRRTKAEAWRVEGASAALGGRFEAGVGGDEGDGRAWPDLSLQVGTIELTGDSAIRYQDEILGVTVDGRLLIDEAQVTGLDTRRPEQPLKFVLREHGEDGTASSVWRGEAYLFGDSPQVSLAGRMESADLTLLSRIAEKALGVEIDRGRAVVELEADVVGEAITGTLGLVTTALQISAAGEEVLSMRQADVRISLAELLRGELKIESAELDGGRLKVERLASGETMVAGMVLSGGEAGEVGGPPTEFPIEALRITDGQLDLVGPVVELAVHVNELELRDRHVAADVVSVRDLELAIVHADEGDWRLTGRGGSTRVQFGFGSKAYEADTDGNPWSDLILQMNRLELAGNSIIRYEDRSVGVPFVQEMRFEQASISDLDSSRPEEFSSIVVSMSSDDYEYLHLDGETQMFSPNPKTRLTGSIEAFALPPLSPLTDMEIGFVIDTGQLDGDVDVRVAEGRIEGFLDLRMNLLRVTATDRERLKPFESSLYEGLRLHQMVFLMTDKQGVMPIRVPVSGDARSPTFGLDIDMNSAVRKAVGIVVAVVVAPIIYSISGGTRAKRPQLAAVYFERGSDNLEERARDRLVRVAATLVAEPERMVTICGIAIKRDAQNRSNTAAEALERELVELARRRAARVRAHLIEQHSIEPRRLVACRPERTSALRPQVDIR